MSASSAESARPFEVATEAFLSQSASIVRPGLVLSLCVTIAPDQLVELVSRLWPDTRPTNLDMDSLVEWPFVLSGESGWSMLESVSRILSSHFQESDPVLFASAHEYLAAMEAEREGGDEWEGWFIRGRTAYYLAGVDPTASAKQFGETFDRAPALDRTTCRVWLAALVDRQSQLLGETSRTVSFFRAFRYYVSGERRMAAGEFDLVLADEQADLYRAISLHLRAMSEQDQTNASVGEMLTESVDLSAKLGLGVNEVMARHSLTWFLLRQGSARDRILPLAKANLEQSRTLDDKGILGWCLRAYAVFRWINYQDDSESSVSAEARAAAPALLGDLSEALALLESVDDLESVLVTLNSRASIFCDLRNIEEALIELETASDRAAELGYSTRILRQLAQTSGRAARLAQDAGLRSELRRLADRFGRLSDRFSSRSGD